MKTIRFAHLKAKSPLKVGQKVVKGDIIGIMGQSGDSTAEDHLHMDSAEGKIKGVFRASQFASGKFQPCFDSLIQFINNDLFGEEFHISHLPLERGYYYSQGQDHYGFDLHQKNYPAKYDVFIRWSSDATGEVLSNGYDKTGYGNYVNIGIKG